MPLFWRLLAGKGSSYGTLESLFNPIKNAEKPFDIGALRPRWSGD
jgi:hypothetical protein